jgi:hypothetical protein
MFREIFHKIRRAMTTAADTILEMIAESGAATLSLASYPTYFMLSSSACQESNSRVLSLKGQ